MLSFKNVKTNDLVFGNWRMYGNEDDVYVQKKNTTNSIKITDAVNGTSINGTFVKDVSMDQRTGAIQITKNTGKCVLNNLPLYVKNTCLTGDSNKLGDVEIKEGEYLHWDGTRWIGKHPTISDITLSAVLKEPENTIPKAIVVGKEKGHATHIPSNMFGVGMTSGFMYWNDDANTYQMWNKNMVQDVIAESQTIYLEMTDGTQETLGDFLNLDSCGVGAGNEATPNSYLYWDSAGYWGAEEKSNVVEDSTRLITSSGVYHALKEKQNVLDDNAELTCKQLNTKQLQAGQITSTQIKADSLTIDTLKVKSLEVVQQPVVPVYDNTRGRLTIDCKSQSYTMVEVNLPYEANINMLNILNLPVKGTIDIFCKTDTVSHVNTSLKVRLNHKEVLINDTIRLLSELKITKNNQIELTVKQPEKEVIYVRHEEYGN